MEKMTHEQYDVAREEIRAIYGDSAQAASANRECALARLYVRSGWTQRELAEKEKLAQSYMNYLLCFGRYLLISNCDQDYPLKEGRFRKFFAMTDKNKTEEERFEDVRVMLEHEAELPRSPKANNRLVKALHATYGDGVWHGLRVMAEKLEVPQEKLQQVLDGMRRTGSHKTFCERRKGTKNDGGWQYRLRPHHGHVVAYDVLMQEIAPFLERLEFESRQNLTMAALGHVGTIVGELKKAVEKLAR